MTEEGEVSVWALVKMSTCPFVSNMVHSKSKFSLVPNMTIPQQPRDRGWRKG